MADPPSPHGPYWWWTRKVNGKTVTRILTAEQYREYAPWFDNARRLRALLSELEGLGLTALEADPRSRRSAKDRVGQEPDLARAADPTANPTATPRSRRP
jgi:hypothetical protein